MQGPIAGRIRTRIERLSIALMLLGLLGGCSGRQHEVEDQLGGVVDVQDTTEDIYCQGDSGSADIPSSSVDLDPCQIV